jgi:hypothetical protein
VRLEGEAGRWFNAGKRDGLAGKMPRAVIVGEIPAEHGPVYNAGWREGRRRRKRAQP